MTKKSCDKFNNLCESFIVVSEISKQITIVFRGTRTAHQLLLQAVQSLNPLVEFFGIGNVNQYFMNAHSILWPSVEEVLNNPTYADYNIAFTGHSLGGALAALAAARIAKQGYRRGDQLTVYTFGEPRVGNVKFAKSYDSMITNSFRVVFRHDIVPHSPACAKKKPLHSTGDESLPCDITDEKKPYHHGTEIWYPKSMVQNSEYLECLGEPKGEDFECSDKVKFHYTRPYNYLWDHRHYFDVRVAKYGQAGCDINQGKTKRGFFDKLICSIQPTPACED